MFRVLEALIESSQEYAHVLSENTKDFTRKQKSSDMTVEAYQKALKDNKRKEQEIDELFFEDSLLLGPIVARVGDLKKRLKKKLAELNRILLEQIKKKVEASKQLIGEEVDNVLQVIRRHSYKNIEEVTETKKFVK